MTKKMIGSPWDLCFSSWIISRTNLHACVSRQTHPQKSFISVSGRPDLTTALFYNHIQASNLAFSLILLQKPYSVLLTTCLQTSTVMKSSCFCMPDMCCTNAGACRQQNPIPLPVACSASHQTENTWRQRVACLSSKEFKSTVCLFSRFMSKWIRPNYISK